MIFLLLASINLPGLKWVLRSWVQEHSHILWASNLDSSTMISAQSHLGWVQAWSTQPSGVHPELPALLGVIGYNLSLLHIFTWESRDVTQQENKGQNVTASAPGVWLSARGDSNDNCLSLSLLHLKHTRAAELFCTSVPCTSMCSQEVKVSLRLLVCLQLGEFFWELVYSTAFHRLEKLS